MNQILILSGLAAMSIAPFLPWKRLIQKFTGSKNQISPWHDKMQLIFELENCCKDCPKELKSVQNLGDVIASDWRDHDEQA